LHALSPSPPNEGSQESERAKEENEDPYAPECGLSMHYSGILSSHQLSPNLVFLKVRTFFSKTVCNRSMKIPVMKLVYEDPWIFLCLDTLSS
jgi:hypothetical protein